MIKVLSGYGGPGGSTVALDSLVTLLKSKGLNVSLYLDDSRKVWTGVKNDRKPIKQCNFSSSGKDTIIYHFLPVTSRPPCKKLILCSHETRVFPIKDAKLKYDEVVYVSNFQKDWQGVPGTVIPNVIRKYKPSSNKSKCAGIIGSVDGNKRIPMSVERALADGHTDVRLYGNISDPTCWFGEVVPLLGEKVSYRGIADDMQAVYDSLTDVYHSPELETFNLIKAECKYAEVNYHGNEGNDTQAEYWDNDRIYEAWKNLIST